MKSKNLLRSITGIALASAVFLSQAVMPSSSVTENVLHNSYTVRAAASTPDECDYVFEVGEEIGGIIVDEEKDEKVQYVLDLSSQVPSDAKIESVMISVSTGSADELAMVAIGCHVPGYNEDDWYSDSGQDTGEELLFTYNIPEEIAASYGSDFTELFIQHWWGTGDQLVTVNKVGVNVSGGAGSAVPGDFDGDKKVKSADLILFSQYMTGEITGDYYDIVADYNGDGTVNILDFIKMKAKFVSAAGGDITDDGKTAIEFVENITVGWNLGNTLESTCDWIENPTPEQFEKAWGNPVTTKEMIDAVKSMGFNTVRVPVSWGQKMGPAPDYKVSDEWMDRVNEVVDYVVENDMYCILNVHHDNDWVVPTNEKYDAACEQLTKLWEQISVRFEKYDEHLIFETLNEPRLVGTDLEWTGGNHEARDCINRFNAAAVETIRSTGGNNALRYIMCPTYAASGSSATVNDYVAPDDDRVIVSIHAYSPYFFALANTDTPGSVSTFGTESDKAALNAELKLLYDKFVSQGRAVVIGEMGAMNKDNDEDRERWAEFYIKTAKSYGIRCVWWDNNLTVGEGERFGLINRSTLEPAYPGIVDALFRGLEG